MCTVSFVPRSDGYLLVCNRDERRSRSIAEAPRWEDASGLRLCAPRDPDGGGSWIALRSDGLTLCLLNGARGVVPVARVVAPSRGRLLLELARRVPEGDVGPELQRRAREGRLIENPFRLLVARAARLDPLRVWEWNGAQLRSLDVDPVHLEVSHGMDPVAGWEQRRRDFETCFGASIPGEAGLLEWHARHLDPESASRSPCMHHALAATVSRTVIEVTREALRLVYQPGAPCEERAPEAFSIPRDSKDQCP